jgi:hypothetical protein
VKEEALEATRAAVSDDSGEKNRVLVMLLLVLLTILLTVEGNVVLLYGGIRLEIDELERWQLEFVLFILDVIEAGESLMARLGEAKR